MMAKSRCLIDTMPERESTLLRIPPIKIEDDVLELFVRSLPDSNGVCVSRNTSIHGLDDALALRDKLLVLYPLEMHSSSPCNLILLRMTLSQLEKLSNVLSDAQDEGPTPEGWASLELQELRNLVSTRLDELLAENHHV